MTDEYYMKQALQLAKKGCGHVNPNPMVGAVLVKGGQVIGAGFHEKYGGLHAERNALAACRKSPEGATLYVTLEPCCHYGKTPPCTEAIIQNHIGRVVIGSADPNPLVAGKGAAALKKAGIPVTQGILKEECDRLNEVFFHYIRTKTPYVVMKYAMTMDGKIAAYTGKSQWITGEPARCHVQESRHQYSGIMAGIGTVLTDAPLLPCRIPGGRNPVRIICDSQLRTPLDSQLARTAKEVPTIIAACCGDTAKTEALRQAGCEVLYLPDHGGHVDLPSLMEALGSRGIDSILLEGGNTLNWSALKAGIVHKIQAYISPKILGGAAAKSPVGGRGWETPDLAWPLRISSIQQIGDDLLIESEVLPCSQES